MLLTMLGTAANYGISPYNYVLEKLVAERNYVITDRRYLTMLLPMLKKVTDG